ncbi:MAG: oxaloacetate decarboxylase subunit alpha [Clostridia bacterium]|nr:oxaloacetate decarboxylase subunit alpha [Clostridia bacterium]
MGKVRITETILRDAHQSLIATRMKLSEMLPAVERLDAIGYNALECWGGATFDSCLRFLNEDPWERLREIKKLAKKTPLQMLLRGQNLLGYKHYPDDVVDYFVQRSIANGIDIIRIFDALNDPRNLERAIAACLREGGHPQGCISYTTSPFHNAEIFVSDAKALVNMGAQSICIKDMAGLLSPENAYELIKSLKSSIKVPIELHTHYTSGLGSMTYLRAIQAGVDIIDTALSPFAMGTSQPPTEPLVAALAGTEYDTGLDVKALNDLSAYFRPIREKYLSDGRLDPRMLCPDINALIYQVPGGMLSNLVSQLKQAGAIDKYDAVLAEVPAVRADLGYPPLVTPTSQIIGSQAVLNVLSGERYKIVTNEVKGLVAGEYGKTPCPIRPEFVKQILGDKKPITCRPADLLEDKLPEFREAVAQYIEQEEDVLTYALFPQPAIAFFKKRQLSRYGYDEDHSDAARMAHYA